MIINSTPSKIQPCKHSQKKHTETLPLYWCLAAPSLPLGDASIMGNLERRHALARIQLPHIIPISQIFHPMRYCHTLMINIKTSYFQYTKLVHVSSHNSL